MKEMGYDLMSYVKASDFVRWKVKPTNKVLTHTYEFQMKVQKSTHSCQFIRNLFLCFCYSTMT